MQVTIIDKAGFGKVGWRQYRIITQDNAVKEELEVIFLRFRIIARHELFTMGQKVLHMYDEMDSVEIWNMENLNTTLRQIEFYRDGQMFKSDKDVFRVYEALEKYLDHLEKQAELGYKFKHGDPDRKPMGKFRMYFNEVVLGDNHMLAVVDGSKIAFIPHSAINIIMTRDVNYCDKFHQYLLNLMKRSTLISEVSEKERSKFFHVLKERILRRKESLRL